MKTEFMKAIMQFLLKILLIILYPVFVGATVALGITTYMRTNELNAIRQSYEQTHKDLNLSGPVETDLAKAVQSLGANLKSTKEDLAKAEEQLADVNTEGGLKKEGYGQITGEILPFVTSGAAITQFQRVCAEQAANEEQVYCISVSAINKGYTLIVPTGEYFVYAQLQGRELDEKLTAYKAYFTQFVACKQKDAQAVCADDLSTKKERVVVENGQTVEKANPIDWKIEGL